MEFSFIKKVIIPIFRDILGRFRESDSQTLEPLMQSPLNGVDLEPSASQVMEIGSISKEHTELLDIDREVLAGSQPIFHFFMILVLFFSQWNDPNLILLPLHDFLIINEPISIRVVSLEHPRELEELVEIAIGLLSRQRGIEQSIHDIPLRIIIQGIFLRSYDLTVMVFMMFGESHMMVVFRDSSMMVGHLFPGFQEMREEVQFAAGLPQSKQGGLVHFFLGGHREFINQADQLLIEIGDFQSAVPLFFGEGPGGIGRKSHEESVGV